MQGIAEMGFESYYSRNAAGAYVACSKTKAEEMGSLRLFLYAAGRPAENFRTTVVLRLQYLLRRNLGLVYAVADADTLVRTADKMQSRMG